MTDFWSLFLTVYLNNMDKGEWKIDEYFEIMRIVQPCHNIPAQKVKSWGSIKKYALAMKKFTSRDFLGNWKSCYAIHHAQVSGSPLNYFTLNENVDKGSLIKMFGSWCVVNARIVKEDEEVLFDEACMSFPHRKSKMTHRCNKITVVYYTPFLNLFLIRRKRKFEGLPAFIVQHENDHAVGKNIYGLK